MKHLVEGLIRFRPNIRTDADGYTWGKESPESTILSTLPAHFHNAFVGKILAERWIVSDDQKFASHAETSEGAISFAQLLERYADEILGKTHTSHYGPHLGVIMKLLDTNSIVNKGALSVQIHPKPGHPTRPSKPEMWKGVGSVYFGWNRDMTPESIIEAVQKGTLEQYMNLVELTEKDLLYVQGGTAHAIRSDSTIVEFSAAPGREEIAKGNIQQATVALYDRTDGKQMRPNKENSAAFLEVMEHAGTFGKTYPEDHFSTPVTSTEEGGERRTIFHTQEVCVDEYAVQSIMSIPLGERGLPLYVEKGTVEVFSQGQSLGKLSAGEEVFAPAHLQEITIFTTSGSTLYSWYKPFH